MLQIINQYICALIMMAGVLLFGILFFNKRPQISTKKLILLLNFIDMIHLASYLTLNGILKSLIMFLTNLIFYKLTFRITFFKSILSVFIYMITLLLVDLFQIFFIVNILGVSKDYYYNHFAGSILGNICTCVLALIFIVIFKNIFQRIEKTNVEMDNSIVLFSILTFICIGLFFYTIIIEFRLNGDVYLYLIAILILLMSLTSLIKQTIKKNKISIEYDQLLEIMKTYEYEIEKQRILRHESKNEFITIKAKIQDDQENKEIIDYIDEILNEKIEVKNEKYAQLGYLPSNGIKGLCYFKVQEAENNGIDVHLNISKKIAVSSIQNLNIKQQRDFGRILGVLLDNAIEASLTSNEKQLGIEVYVNRKNELKMTISNTYNNKVDKSKLGKEHFSTKDPQRGHGLLLVKVIVNNNKNFRIDTNIQDKIYSQTVTVASIQKNENNIK